jgi:serine O-acetyltransferase
MRRCCPAARDRTAAPTNGEADVKRALLGLTALAGAGLAYCWVRSPGGCRAVDRMKRDVQSVKERDPAANGTLEVVTSYPGLHALWLHRLAHHTRAAGVPLLPRWISQINRLVTGIEIHPGATIGNGLFIDHGAGVVVGETTEIGDNVTLYQGVTLGVAGKETGKRHPTLGDNVVVGAGAKLLGSITVGSDAKIGAGSVVVQNVPTDSTVVGNPGRPVLLDGQRVGIPDIDYRHLPDPVAEAFKCLVTRIVEMEQELDEIHPDRKGKRKAAVAQTQRLLSDFTRFDAGAGI